MNLVVDQGNTQFKIGIFDNSQIIHSYRFNYSDIKNFQRTVSNYPVEFIIVSSVVDTPIDFSFLNKEVIVFSHYSKLPIQNLYKTPNTLGLDRLANATGAWTMNKNKASLVIDCGTCIKYDIVSEHGVYLGGNIAPGLQMRFKSLNAFTDKLPLLTPNASLSETYGTDTESSLQCGVILGIEHEINGFISRYKKEFNGLTIFMTGGDLKYFDKTDKRGIFANQNLTLIGLNEILKHNASLQ